jgi:hypothetical protein
MNANTSKRVTSRREWRIAVLSLAFLSLTWVGFGPGTAQTNKAKRIISFNLSESQEGSRVTVVADIGLGDYEAFRRGDRFYVRIPASELISAQPRFHGNGFDDIQVQRSSDSVIISFKLQPGATARVDQRLNRLDVVFTAVRFGNSAAGSRVATQAVESDSAQNSGRRSEDLVGPVPPGSQGVTDDNSARRAGNVSSVQADARNTTPEAAGSQTNQTSTATQTGSDSNATGPTPTESLSATPSNESSASSRPTAPPAQPSATVAGVTSSDRWRTLQQWWRLNRTLGIVLLVVVGLLLLFLIVWLFLRVRDRRAKKAPKIYSYWKGEKVGPRYGDPSDTSTPSASSLLDEIARITPAQPDYSEEELTETVTAPANPEELELPLADASLSHLSEVNDIPVEPPFSNTPAHFERTDLELRKLLSGREYDASVVDASDSATRHVVAATLIGALASRNFEQHDHARKAFVDYGYFDETTRDLRTGDSPAERAAAARKLGVVGDAHASAHLIAALYDTAPEVRRASVESLGQVGDPTAIAPLNELLQRENSRQLPEAVIRHAINSIAVTEAKRATPVEKSPLRVVEKAAEPVSNNEVELREALNRHDLVESVVPVTLSQSAMSGEELQLQLEEEALRRAAEELERRRLEAQLARQRAAEEARAKAELEARARAEVEARIRMEEEARRQAEQEALRKKLEEEARVRLEQEARLKLAQEAERLRAEEDNRFKQEAETLRRAAEELARKRAAAEAAQKLAEEENRRRAEAEARRVAEANARAQAEAELRQLAELEMQRRVEAEAKRSAEEEARKQAELTRQRSEAEVRRLAEEQFRKLDEARQRTEADTRRLAEEQSQRLAEPEVLRRPPAESLVREADERRKAEEQQLLLEQEALLKAADEVARRRREVAEARKKAEEEAEMLVAAQERILAAEEARRQAEEERQRLELETRSRAEEERRRFEEARRRALEEQQRLEEEARVQAEEQARLLMAARERIRAEEEARGRAEAERQLLEADAQRRAEEERQRYEAAQQRLLDQQRKLEEEARLRAEEEEHRLAELERVRKQAEDHSRQRAEVEQRIRAEIEALHRAEESQRQRIEAETRRRAEAELRLREEKQRRQAEEEARIKAEREAHLAEAARLQAEEDAHRRNEEDFRILAERDARLRAEEEVRRREEEEKRYRAEREARLRGDEDEQQRLVESYRRKAEEEERQRTDRDTLLSNEEAQRRAEEEQLRELEEEARIRMEKSVRLTTEEQVREPEVQVTPETPVAADEAVVVAELDKGIDVVRNEKGLAPFAEATGVSPDLTDRLTSSSPAERSAALNDLARMGGDDAFLLISRSFDDQSPDVRNAAARALYDLQPDRAASFTRALREGTPDTRRRIGAALAASGLATDAIANLTGESREKTYDAFSLLFLMAKAGEVQPLMKAIEDYPNVEVRLAVVKLLALSGQPEIVPAFRRLAVRGSLPAEVRSAVMEAIYQISTQNRETPAA